MKKILLILGLVAVVLGLIYYIKYPFRSKISAGQPPATEEPIPLVAETSSLGTRSAESAEQKTKPFVPSVASTDRFAGATVIKSRQTAPDKDGRYERKRLVKADFKYPLILLDEHLQVDLQTGAEHLVQQAAMVADHVIVKVPAGMNDEQVNQEVALYGGQIRKKMYAPDLYLVEFQNVDLDSVAQAVQKFSKDTGFIYAEPDYIGSINETTPDDTNFNLLWGMHNFGQTIGGQAGYVDADIDAPEAWELSTGSSDIIVAVIDTGIDYTHSDLSGNMWRNPGEISGNNIDDDGNGFIDDVYGWDFANDDNDPMDDHFHGTHCAGTIGGAGNNSAGVAGVCWNVRMMALKFLSSSGRGAISDAIDATHYSTKMRVKLSSNSWGGGGFSQGLFDAIEEAGRSNSLFIAAAGNASANTDASPNYPSCYTNENIIAVAATDNRDQLAYFSNYGLTSVDLGAPGVYIWSCKPGNQYQYLSGTSMAAPHVAGACALVWSINPYASAVAIKQAILDGTEPITVLNSKCVTGGRLNVFQALQKLEQNIALAPATGLSLSGFCGGPFSPGSSAYTISNIGTNVFSWTASQTTNWLDFSATTGTLSPGQSNIVVVSVNTGNANQLAVGTYTNTLTFSSTLNTNVQLRTVILTVHGEISFSSASYSVLEGAGTALINVYRNGNTNRSVTVDFATSNGTATAGLDYISTNGTLTFAAGESEKTFGIEIIDDTLSIEPGESVLLALSNPTGDSTLEIPSSATLMILDNTVTNGLVLKYTFDPDTSPIATDGSPFGNNGSLTNASVVPGQSGNGVSFNGTNAYIEAPPSASLLPTEMTLAMWVKIPNIPTSDKTLIFKRNANIDFNEDYALEITPAGKARAVLGYGIGQTLLDSTSLVTGRWQHIAVTFSQPQFKIYVDGKLSGTATHNQPLQHNTNTYLFIGCRDHALYSKERFLSGVMDDVCIYNRALTAEEIALLVPKTYSLTVENGIGSGSYTNGTLVEIAADAPFAGMIFSQWSGAVQYVENVTASVTTVTMPGSNITVTATYTNLPGWYTLTVHNGSGSGLYSNGTAVVVTADNPSAGNVFDRWTGDTQYIDDATSPTAIVSIVSQDVTLTATYRTNLYTLVVENGSGDGSYAIGSVVPVSAEPIAGMVFTGWTTVPAAYTNRLANRLATSTTFTMPETNVVLTASYNSLTNGLVLKYTFDPDTSPVATDGSSYGNNGQLTNATIVTGQSGNCLSLNGSNAYIRTPSSASLMPTAITLSTWIKMASIPVADQTLIFKRNTNFNMNETFSLEITPEGKARIALSSSSGQSLLDSFALTTGRWQHIAVTFSQPQLAIYVDGKLQGTAYYNKALQNNSNSALFIGCRDHSSYPLSRFFDGVIDDICVYNRALSSNEIASLAIPTYLLTVENGTGYGTYTNGETVAVSAYAPAEGFVFSSWTTVPVTYTNRLANRLSASTTFTMPATNILLTANYRITNLYVDASRPDDAGAGTSWATAKKTIQAAINLATEGDTVWVTNGTYSIGTAMTPGGSLPNRIVATNDITICSVNGPDVTLIQGRGPVGTNAIRGAYLSGRSRLIGFTVESGATFSSDNATGFSSYGGGIYCYGGSTVSNCVVRDNASKNNGGGLYVNLNGNLVCNTTIVNNQTEYGGAGVGLGVGGNSIIRDCRIINNRAANKGGGVFIYHSGTLENCLIANNSATNSAGGVYTDYGSFGAYIKNCTISGNKAQSYGGLDYIISGATVYNSVIWGNTNGNWNGGSYTYCDTTPLPSGAGNLSTDPLFADADYRLGSGSPCINAGSNSYTSVTNDLDGNPRIIDGAVDIGAYEFYGEQEDYDGDGLPNRWEFLHFRTITGGRADAICSNGINTIRQAYIAGVNPNDPQSKFQVELVSERVLQWPSVSGRVYSVCFSTNLLNDFQPLFTNISWSVGCFTDLVHDADCQMFYKIDVQTE